MKTMYRAALAAAAFVFLLPLSARSEIKAGSVELGPYGGYNFFESSQNLENKPVFGGRLGYNFTRHFGVEGVVGFIGSGVDDKSKTGLTEGQYGSPMDDVDLTFYHVDAVYHFMPEGRFNPFVVVGFGGAHYRPEISTKDMAAFNAGVGAKYWVTDNIALRVDVQDYMVTEILQETYHNIGVTLGISFAFGGKAKPAPVQAAKYELKPEPAPVPAAKYELSPAPIPEPVQPVAEQTVEEPVEEPAAVVAAEPMAETEPEPVAEEQAEEKVIILASEPEVEEAVVAAVSEPKAEEKIIVLAFEDVHFDFDQSTLTPEAQTILKRNVRLLKDNPKAEVRIAGYTSASGTEEYNQKLSERRANAVQKYLVSEGIITRDRLTTIGYGETRPEMLEAAPKQIYSKAAKANMRVLFEIIMQ